MSDKVSSISSSSKDLKALNRQLVDFRTANQQHVQLTETLLKRVSELEAQLHQFSADLDDERTVRRTWRARAEDVESRVAKNQFVLLLVDGNQYVFKDRFLREGSPQEALQIIVSEVLDHCKERHKSDLPEATSVVIHFFLDLKRLQHELLASGTIHDQKQLSDFLEEFCSAYPLLTVTDCGPGETGSGSKLKDLFELFIENCHCRHIILALGHQSEYYGTLHAWAEDEYTTGRTSLVKPAAHDFPAIYNLQPFPVMELSCLGPVPLISVGADFSTSQQQRPADSSFGDLQSLQDKPDQVMQHRVHAEANRTSNSSNRSQPSSRAASNVSKQGSLPSTHSSQAIPNPGWAEHKDDVAADEVVAKQSETLISHMAQDGELQAPSGGPARSTWGWENAPPENSYQPPPRTLPWGQEDTGTWANDQPATNSWDAGNWSENRHARPPSRPSVDRQRWGERSKRQGPRKEHIPSHTFDRGPGGAVKTFTGSWDDLFTSPNPTKNNTRNLEDSHGHTGGGATARAPILSDVAVNASGQRIDLDLPSASAADQQRLQQRISRRKVCNEYQLRNACNSRSCPLDHEPLDPGALNALRYVARRLPCSIGPRCRRPDCFYGHHCPFVTTEGGCTNAKCQFHVRGMHEVSDTTVVDTIPA